RRPPSQRGMRRAHARWNPSRHVDRSNSTVVRGRRRVLRRVADRMASSPKAGAPLALSYPPSQQGVRGEHLRLLQAYVPVVTWTTDAALRITSVAGSALTTLAIDPAHLRGRTLAEFFETSDETFLPIAVHRRVLAGRTETYRIDLHGRTYQSYVEPLRDGEAI